MPWSNILIMNKRHDQVNYIIQHKNAIEKLTDSKGFKPSHISIYEALFQLWNQYRFPVEFSICRHEIMELSGISSKDIYTDSIKELDKFGLIKYLPSFDRTKGSRVQLIRFDITGPKNGKGNGKGNGIDPGKDVGPLNKQDKTEEEEKKNRKSFLGK